MKKLYFTLALAAVAATAAANATLPTASLKAVECNKQLQMRQATPTKHAQRAAADDADVVWNELGVGKYKATVLPAVYSGSTEMVDVTVYEQADKPGMYKLVGVWPDLVQNGELIVDATDPEFVVVPNQFTGLTDTDDGQTFISSVSYWAVEDLDFTKEQILGSYPELNIALVDGIMNIPSGALSLQWPDAPEDSKWDTDPGEWYQYETDPGMIILPGANYVDPWAETFEATWNENLIYALFAGVQNTTFAPTTVQHNSETGLYRINNAYQTLFTDLGAGSNPTPLVFDASNPDDVQIELQHTGISQYYIFSESWYEAQYGDPEDPVEYPMITLVENEDGSKTLTIPYHSATLYDASASKFYYAAGYESVLNILPNVNTGVESVNTTNGAAEYFNLQGVRVANPAEGQLLIKVQDGKAVKTIVK